MSDVAMIIGLQTLILFNSKRAFTVDAARSNHNNSRVLVPANTSLAFVFGVALAMIIITSRTDYQTS